MFKNKTILSLLVLVTVLCLLPGFTGCSDDSDNFCLYYREISRQVDRSKLYIKGSFVNTSTTQKIVDFQEITIGLYDSNGNLLTTVALNDNFARNTKLGLGKSVRYNFSCPLSTLAVDNIYDIYIEALGEYTYLK